MCFQVTPFNLVVFDCNKHSLVSGGGPPTPLSPFEPHNVEFPPTAATFSVAMERGFIVLTKIPNKERNSLVRNYVCMCLLRHSSSAQSNCEKKLGMSCFQIHMYVK